MSANTAVNNGERHDFSKFQPKVPVPDLLAIQLESWESFLQEDVLSVKRENIGLEAVFKNMFPVEDTRNDYVLEYKSYYLGLPKYTEKECLERRITLAVPLKVRFVLNITDENDRSKYVQSIEQDVFFGNIPYMTDSGTFIINGAERVIVSQLQRSPGVFFDQNFHPNGTKIFFLTFEFRNEVGPTPATNVSIYRNLEEDVGIGLPRLPRVLCCSLGTK